MWLDNYLPFIFSLLFIIFILGIIFVSINNNDPEKEFSTLNNVGRYMIISGLAIVLIIFMIYC